jgi:aerobic-type carbon monoxide dehydrogenase small subunit (CoxS/CutS family)
LIENPQPTRTQVAEWLSGNICRCGAYGAIAQSILEAAKENLPSLSKRGTERMLAGDNEK